MVMLLGLRNAIQSIQCFIHKVVRDFNLCDVYVDEILASSTLKSEHRTHLSILFKKLKNYWIAINTSKCVLWKEVLFFGHYILKHSIRHIPQKISLIKHFNKAQIVAKLQCFLTTMNFYRRLIPKAAQIQSILNNYIKGSKKYDIRLIV